MIYELTEVNHHHLICKSCGRTVAVEHAPLARLYNQPGSSTGFKLDSSLMGRAPG